MNPIHAPASHSPQPGPPSISLAERAHPIGDGILCLLMDEDGTPTLLGMIVLGICSGLIVAFITRLFSSPASRMGELEEHQAWLRETEAERISKAVADALLSNPANGIKPGDDSQEHQSTPPPGGQSAVSQTDDNGEETEIGEGAPLNPPADQVDDQSTVPPTGEVPAVGATAAE